MSMSMCTTLLIKIASSVRAQIREGNSDRGLAFAPLEVVEQLEWVCGREDHGGLSNEFAGVDVDLHEVDRIDTRLGGRHGIPGMAGFGVMSHVAPVLRDPRDRSRNPD